MAQIGADWAAASLNRILPDSAIAPLPVAAFQSSI
jgi:FXSXX-COOH protein